MISRRSFLWLASATAAVRGWTGSRGISVEAAAGNVAAEQRGGSDASGAPVPRAIAALQSMKDQARPITADERRGRIERAKQLMVAEKIDAIMLSGGTSSLYFANIPMGGSERLWALLIPARGQPFIVCPGFEEDRARELLTDSPWGKDVDVRTWQEDESPFQRVTEGLKDHGIRTGRLGIEETVKFVFADSIAQAGAPALQLVSATPITAGCRMIKDAHEIELLRLASQATLKVYEAVYRSLAEGMTQATVSSLIQAAYARVGFPGFASLNIGEYTALPHGSRTPQTIREGTIIMVGRWLPGGGISVGHHAHVRARQAGRQDEAGVRDRPARAAGSTGGGAADGGTRVNRRGGPQSRRRCGLRTGVQVFHPPGRTRAGHGHARMAVSGSQQHVRLETRH